MLNSVFVGRETELRQLETALDAAHRGTAQVIFVAGEAGAGKSTLVAEFLRRAANADPSLIFATGECNAQTGAADPYLPFRQVLVELTSSQDEKNSHGTGDEKRIGRWKEFVQVAGKTLLMVGPDLVGIFIPGGQVLTRIGTTIGLNTNLAAKLSERIGKKPGKDTPKIDPALDQERIFEQYAAVLKALAKEHPLALVLDDLQWADSASLNLLFHLARQLKDSRVLLVGTYRPDDVALGRGGERHPLEPILNELKRYNGDIVIDLGQAGTREGRGFVDALVDSEPNRLDRAFRDELLARTGGQPLFTVELLRSLKESGGLVKDAQGNWIESDQLDWKTLPARVDGVIGERLARLPAGLRETLSVASVAGYDFAAQVVGRVQQADEGELVRTLSRQLEKRYMLVTEQGEIKVGRQYLSLYRFSHVLIQRYLYENLSAGERRLLHAEIAAALEAIYGGDAAEEIALQLAHHFEAGGDDEKAFHYLVIAGDAAFRSYAHAEAIAAYTRALDLGSGAGVPAETLSHVYIRCGRALELNSQYELALQSYDTMLAYAVKHHDRSMELAARLAAGTLYSTITPVANPVKGQNLSEETLRLARELGDRASESRALWNLQLVNLLQNKSAAAIDYGEQSLAIARQLDLREQMAYVLSDLGWAYIVGCQFDKCGERLEEGARLWRELGNQVMLSNNLNSRLFQLYWTGNNEPISKVAEETYQLSASIKEIWNQASARKFQGVLWLEQGEVDRGLAALEESIKLAAQGNRIYEIWYSAVLIQAYAEQGLVAGGMPVYQARRIADADLPVNPSRSATLVGYALFEIASGQLEKAAATLAVCQPDAVPWEMVVHMARCRLALAQGKPAEAIELASEALALAGKYGLGQHMPEAWLLKARCHAALGELPALRAALEQARRGAEGLGSRRLLWQIISGLAALESDPQRSAALAADAREIIDFIAQHIASPDMRQEFLRFAGANMVSSWQAMSPDHQLGGNHP